MGWVWTAILAVLTIVLFFMVFQGVVYIGWALGGFIGVVLAILLAIEVITDGGFFLGLLGLVVICVIIDLLF